MLPAARTGRRRRHLANFIVTASNWNSAAFWNGIDVSGPGHTLDFSALPSNFSVDFYPAATRILVSDGTNFFIIGDSDYGGGTAATMAGTTQLEFFTTVIGSDGNDMVDGGVNDDTVIGVTATTPLSAMLVRTPETAGPAMTGFLPAAVATVWMATAADIMS